MVDTAVTCGVASARSLPARQLWYEIAQRPLHVHANRLSSLSKSMHNCGLVRILAITTLLYRIPVVGNGTVNEGRREVCSNTSTSQAGSFADEISRSIVTDASLASLRRVQLAWDTMQDSLYQHPADQERSPMKTLIAVNFWRK